MPMAASATEPMPFLKGLEAAPAAGGGPAWLAAARAEALARFREAGVPTPKVESWKYTNLARLARTAFAPALAIDGGAQAIPAGRGLALPGAARLVSVNGRFRPDLSDLATLPAGVEVEGLAAHLAHAPEGLAGELGRLVGLAGRPFAALNAALWQDGLVLRVAPGATIETPLHLISIGVAGGEPSLFHPRLLVRVGKGASATLVESHVSLGGEPCFANEVSEVTLAEGAVFHHYRLIDEAPESYHIGTSGMSIGRDAHYDSFAFTVGGRLVRSEVHLRLDGPGSDAHVNGAYLVGGESHVDNTGLIEHVAPHASSRQTFKGVLFGRARGVFQGKILVRRDAQKTDGYQLHQALLLSPGAEVDAKPELEIYADDVKCSHGATTGALDADALFYLMSRGIAEAEAWRMLTEAFVKEVIEEVKIDSVAEAFRDVLVGRLAAIEAGDGGRREGP
ncbi:MAG: Fe-S cluster assembly protein SufD [Proteobacteria bacterium]|nr:Fe-S cluster assembly protein SufD [Pseudomonadota bacterium]